MKNVTPTKKKGRASFPVLMIYRLRGVGVDGGSRCRMSIIRNCNVALSNLRKAPLTLSNLRKAPVALSNLRKAPVACH